MKRANQTIDRWTAEKMFVKQIDMTISWLAFELNVLRRLKFKSAILPLMNETKLGAQLKRWDVRVAANDAAHWSHTQSLAEIQNNTEQLSADDLALILEDAYVPRYELQNAALRNRFSESDAWWFDNVRRNIEKLSAPIARAIALSVGMRVGDYVFSFTDETREFRQPLSKVFRTLHSIAPQPFDNNQKNICANKPLNDFVAENYTDLMFLRLPPVRRSALKDALGQAAWREEWIRGNNDFWNDLEMSQTGRLGARVETKTQYLQLVENILQTASHIPQWAIAHAEDGFITTQEIVETVNHVRRVETIFTKDFSELTGAKAVIITA